MVYSLDIRCILASKVSPKATCIYRMNLVKLVKYKASDYIKFRTGKEFLNSTVLI